MRWERVFARETLRLHLAVLLIIVVPLRGSEVARWDGYHGPHLTRIALLSHGVRGVELGPFCPVVNYVA